METIQPNTEKKIEVRCENKIDLRIRSGIMMGVGLGDAFKDLAHTMGGDKIAALYTKVTGNDCGCADRQKQWNAFWPKFR